MPPITEPEYAPATLGICYRQIDARPYDDYDGAQTLLRSGEVLCCLRVGYTGVPYITPITDVDDLLAAESRWGTQFELVAGILPPTVPTLR